LLSFGQGTGHCHRRRRQQRTAQCEARAIEQLEAREAEIKIETTKLEELLLPSGEMTTSFALDGLVNGAFVRMPFLNSTHAARYQLDKMQAPDVIASVACVG
jgi:hypothetical protein